ncbi:tRNA (adenosine(37)-N6)-dimethylallyltransferase MiaA [Candidatus Falkowbacteria bacterium]|nr:tRNA (adenosine(37)-N6)-dimethylallyltransferase MiaA [Candidatus Falkowbacteria bacterium]
MAVIKKAIAIIGPTSAGKTKLAITLAAKYNGEIISADSRQVYRGLDIGSGKDLADYDNNGQPIPHHLIDVADPGTSFDLANYQRLARQALEQIQQAGKLPVIAGGSGLYLQALIDNYQLSTIKPNTTLRQESETLDAAELFQKLQQLKPVLAERLNNSDKNNPRRLIRYLEIASELPQQPLIGRNIESDTNWLILGVDYPLEVLEQRIRARLIQRLEQEDMINEVYNLHEAGVDWQWLEGLGLEYRYISRYLKEQLDYDEMIEQLAVAIRQFAKRQKTWFKRWAKQGREIHWLNTNNPLKEAEELVERFL